MNKLAPVFRTLAQVAVAAVTAFLAVHFGLVVDPTTATALVGALTAVLTVGVTAAQHYLERRFPKLGSLLHTPAYPAEVQAAVADAEEALVAKIVDRLSQQHAVSVEASAAVEPTPPAAA